jgi:hypothetical protein
VGPRPSASNLGRTRACLKVRLASPFPFVSPRGARCGFVNRRPPLTRTAKGEKATSGFEPLLREKAERETQSPEPSSPDVPELNPFLRRILERVTQSERERSR